MRARLRSTARLASRRVQRLYRRPPGIRALQARREDSSIGVRTVSIIVRVASDGVRTVSYPSARSSRRYLTLKSVRSASYSLRERALGERPKVALQLLAVVPPRFPVDPGRRVSLEGDVRGSEPGGVIHMVKERREPLGAVPLRDSTYSLKWRGHAGPALSPGRALLKRLALGPLPSLPTLRDRSFGVVRVAHWYYGAVRLPRSVRHRRTSRDFPIRSAHPRVADTSRPSRFPSRRFRACAGSPTAWGSAIPCVGGIDDVAFRLA
jgi:hypothetical protein